MRKVAGSTPGLDFYMYMYMYVHVPNSPLNQAKGRLSPSQHPYPSSFWPPFWKVADD
jgi:hypothetical protein